jgi:hypothetical protein
LPELPVNIFINDLCVVINHSIFVFLKTLKFLELLIHVMSECIYSQILILNMNDVRKIL